MPNSQTPLWVSMLLAGIALIGPLGAAWITTKRDDKRWSRELARERERWQREDDKRRQDLSHESRMNWRDRRVEAYSELHDALMLWLEGAVKAVDATDAEFADEIDMMDERAASVRRLVSRIRVVGSRETEDAADRLLKLVYKHYSRIKRKQTVEEISEVAQEIYTGRQALEICFRMDLGLAGVESQVYS
ncbi:hypothetical protein ACXIZN_11695 [Amycolatopsis sp. TRM77291]